MPVVHALGRQSRRFSELELALPGTTPRALTAALKDLTEAGLVRRDLRDDYPPTTAYRLTTAGGSLVTPLVTLHAAVSGAVASDDGAPRTPG